MTGEPFECTMSMQDCPSTIGLWTLGSPGECLYRGAGIRMGTNGFKKVALQVHWTNPEKKEDLWDSSGLTLFYTKHLRKYDSGTMFTGQSYLEIPPLSPKVVQHSTCSPRCTQKIINGSIFITSGLNHMHYLGIAGYVRLTRSDGTVLKLNDDKYYSYDTPIRHQYDPPVEVKPGDSLETVCTYRSMSRKQTAFWGLGTYAEMCYGIFNFFPVEAMPFSACSTSNNLEDCDFFESGCDFAAILNFTNPNTIELHQKVMKACTYMGVCQHGCRKVVEDIKMNNNCFKNSLYDFVYRQYLQKQDEDTVDAFKFVIAMKSCDWESENPIDYKEPVTDYGIHISASFILCISCIAYLVL